MARGIAITNKSRHGGRGSKGASWTAQSWRSSDGLNLFYRDYAGSPDRPPLLCLPGLTRNSRDFEDFANIHAGEFRVIAVDYRGRGMSDRDPLPARYLPTTYAADVLKLLDEIGIDRAIFVGTSLGGIVTMLIAAMQPQRIAAAILNDIGPDIDQAGLDRIRDYVGRPVRFGSWDEAAEYISGVNRGLPTSFDHDDWVLAAHRLCKDDGDGIVFDYDLAIAEPFNQRNYGAAPFDMWPLYRRLAKAPLLIVRGEKSDLLKSGTAERMVEEAADAEVVVIPGVGHAPELTEAEGTAAIERFLKRVAP